MKAFHLKAASEPKDYPPADRPEIAVVGRSNVGKSSFINRLVGQAGLARTSKTPGRTQLIHFFETDQNFRLVDLPGYGFAKVPAKVRGAWQSMIEKYLSGRQNLMMILCLVDARHPASQQDIQLLNWLRSLQIPSLSVATKADKLSKNELASSLKNLSVQLGMKENLIASSAISGQGKNEVLATIKAAIKDFSSKSFV